MTEAICRTAEQRQAALQLLQWNVMLGADEIIPLEPRPRAHAIARDMPPKARSVASEARPSQPQSAVSGGGTGPPPSRLAMSRQSDPDDAVRQAEALAAKADDLVSLAAAIDQFKHCSFRQEATHMVFADGNPAAWVMLVGEAPGREEDLAGKPFVGRSGQLIDAMYGEIGLARTGEQADDSLYITNVVNWRPEGNRQPTEAEIAMFKPFLLKHIALIAPRILVLHGNPACRAILGRDGITRLRGHWASHGEIPVLPMFHPAYLLRNATIKRMVWNDLLMIKTRHRELANE